MEASAPPTTHADNRDASINYLAVSPPIADLALTIAGRTFRHPQSTTIVQDAYVMQRQRAFGLESVLGLDLARDSVTGASAGVIMAAFESGLMYEILAGVLVEDGVKWTKDVAAANTRFFAELTDQADKSTIWLNIAEILKGFLEGAAEWSRSFPSSSRNGAARPMETTATTNGPSGEPPSTIMESGTALSASLPVTT